MLKMNGWCWYFSGEEDKLDLEKCGKWMFFFQNQKMAMDICEKAMKEHVCYECKCTDMDVQQVETGVLCFYLNGDDVGNHKRVIRFMMENNLIRKTKTGKYYNISFKFDKQTCAGEYGADFEGKIKLENFIDLKTGEWIL